MYILSNVSKKRMFNFKYSLKNQLHIITEQYYFFFNILRPTNIAPIEIIPKNTIKTSWDNSPKILCLLSKREKNTNQKQNPLMFKSNLDLICHRGQV